MDVCIVLGELFLMDRFFDGLFFRYGIDVISYINSSDGDRRDPFIYLFPRMAMCTFQKFGSSGRVDKQVSIEIEDNSHCVLITA